MSFADQVGKAKAILERPDAKIHLIGVGGCGMAGLAHMLLDAGYQVSGSDLRENDLISSLKERGAMVYHEHQAEQVGEADAVVYSTAVRSTNPERQESERRGIEQFRRAEFLSALLKDRKVIAVTGTHGKTTTTMILAKILFEAGLNPSYYIGAEVPTFGVSAQLNPGAYAVIEADESDGTFLAFEPEHLIILNIDRDHLDYYQSDEEIVQAFQQLFDRCPGHRILCRDDAGNTQLKTGSERVHWYGLSGGTELPVTSPDSYTCGSDSSDFNLGGRECHLSLPGVHNLSNAMSAITLARLLGVTDQDIVKALSLLKGASRRFEVLYEGTDGRIVDDYAHHPAEIKATIAAARNGFSGKLIGVFQPHRYSRTELLFDEFAEALAGLDEVIITSVYGAGEEDPGTSPDERLVSEIKSRQGTKYKVRFVPDWKGLIPAAMRNFKDGDCLLTLGAGNIGSLAESIAKDFYQAAILRSGISPSGRVRAYEPLHKHTTLRVGGPAQFWVEPVTEDDVTKALKFAKNHGLEWMVIGRGSNLLIRDLGFSGLCLHFRSKSFSKIHIEGDTIEAGAGARLKEIAYGAQKAGLAGFEFMEGIPASVGGALRMNAGAMQSWMFEVVQSIRMASLEGEILEVPASDIQAQYRHVPILEKNIALSARMKGTPDEPDAIRERMQLYSKKRWSSQPAAPSAGCTFKNPDSTSAGRLIDELGLKDKKIGGARISSVHANFIVNDGDATTRDILELIEFVQQIAREKRGQDLELEVVLVGDE
ncbi:MAG: UDP-N-acetylmuramate--L-alanine ligase [Verrucomicrobiota bacterium]